MKFLSGAILAVALANAGTVAETEIVGLLDGLRISGCRFQRNGTWYDAAKASDHLARKRDYFSGKGKLASAEDFIRLAATQSSMSGKPYRVACPDRPEVDSKVWLEAKLKRLRSR